MSIEVNAIPSCPKCGKSDHVIPDTFGHFDCLDCFEIFLFKDDQYSVYDVHKDAFVGSVTEHPPDIVQPQHNGNANDLLKKHFGHEQLTGAQSAAIEQITQGRDALVVLPTSAGKSAIYQLSAIMLGGLTVVVSPLIALMYDQITKLQQRNIAAITINSHTKKSDRTAYEKQLCEGKVRLLYLAPESLEKVTPLLSNVSHIAVDEAHCISQYGFEFRRDYRKLGRLREQFPNAVVSAFTASATQDVRQDIIEQLRMHNPFIHIGNFNRPNLSYDVIQCHDRYDKITKLAALLKGSIPAIVYTRTRNETELVAAHLKRQGIHALAYHAGLKSSERTEVQQLFMSGKTDIMVATTAFGLGIDKPDVRSVIHFDVPDCMERYYQESGRAGRDGKSAQCILLYNENDIDGQEFLISRINSSSERHKSTMNKLSQMRDYAISGGGYREQILQYLS